MNQLNELEEAIKELYLSAEKLRAIFSGRKFPFDGLLVGDMGEAIAALEFNVILDSKKHWDGYWKDENGVEHKVQVKATQNNDTYLKKPPHEGTFLVFKIFPNGKHEVIYNGSIMKVWKYLENQNIKEKMISIERLKKLQSSPDLETIKNIK